MGLLKSFIIFLLWFFLIMNTFFFVFQLYILALDEDASEGFLSFLHPNYNSSINGTFTSSICLITNLISQILVLLGNTYPAVFFCFISFSFLTLKLIGFTVRYLNSLDKLSSYSIKDLKKSVQTSCFYNQNLLFFWFNFCIVGLLFQIYSNWWVVFVSVVIWILSYCLFFFSIKFNLLLLEKTIFLFLFIRGIILLHDGPWYFFAAIFSFFLYHSMEKTVVKEKFMSFKKDLILSTAILKEHYIIEVYLFFILKVQSLWFLVLFFFSQNTLHADIQAGIASYSSTLLEIFLVFKTHVLFNLIVCFIIDFIITKHFNIPQPSGSAGLVSKSVVLGGLATGVLAGSALSDSATSTTIDPGDGWVMQKMQMWKQGFTSSTKEGNVLGKTCLHVAGVKPPVYRGTNEINLSAAFELVSNGLETEKQAKLASWMTGIDCKPYSDKKGPYFFSAMSKKDK